MIAEPLLVVIVVAVLVLVWIVWKAWVPRLSAVVADPSVLSWN